MLLGLWVVSGCAKAIVVAASDAGPVGTVDATSIGLDAAVAPSDSGASQDAGAPPDASASGDASTPDAGACATDFDCAPDQRCEGSTCIVAKRIGSTCAIATECPSGAHCDLTEHRCDQWCASDISCPAGYRCSPDGYCIESCSAVPATLGQTCLASPDCARCGVCIDTNGTDRCRMLCRLDRDCPGGAAGACVDEGSYRVCAP